MSFVKNVTPSSNLEEDILHHLSELRYHEDAYYTALEEASHHLNKFLEHDLLVNELSASNGVFHGQ
jgi:hypothetical protein